MIGCECCHGLLSEYVDGTLELGERVDVERHLAACEPCRVVRDDFLQIIHFSRQLPEHVPSGNLWQRIHDGVQAERSGRFARFKLFWTRINNRGLNFRVSQIATAAVAVMALGVAGSLLANRESPTGDSETPSAAAPLGRLTSTLSSSPDISRIESRINDLNRTVEQRKVLWNPELQVAFERNMTHIEQSLAECRHAFSQNPGDADSRDLMMNAYREKMRVLEGFARF